MLNEAYWRWAGTNIIGISYDKAGGRSWWFNEEQPSPFPFGGVWFYSGPIGTIGLEFWETVAAALLTFGDNNPIGRWQYYETQGYTFEFEQDFLLFKLIMGDQIRDTLRY